MMIGVESMAQEELNALNKRSNVEKLYEAVQLCRRHGIVTVGFYMIGLESDTEESIRASIEKLAAMRLDLVQVCILTPLPQTPLWQRIQDCYGIDDKDYSHFDGKHLVWRHPALSKGQIEGLLDWSFKTLYPRANFARTIVKHARAHARRVGRWRAPLPGWEHAQTEADVSNVVFSLGKPLNAQQRRVVRQAAGSSLLYVWGPPGTGKTSTLAAVVHSLYLQGKSVLLVSNTNIAVDTALERIGDRLSTLPEFHEAAVLRFGPIVSDTLRAKYQAQVDIDSVVERHSAALVERQKGDQAGSGEGPRHNPDA